MIGWINVVKGLLKSKVFWVVATLALVSVYVYKYTSLVEDLQKAYVEVAGLSKALETTNKSIEILRDDMRRIDQLLIERDNNSEQIRNEINSIREELRVERENNEKLQECWGVSHGNAFDGMRSPTAED